MPGRCRAFCQGKAAGSSLPVGSAVAPSLPRLLRAPLSHFLPAAAPPSSLPAPRAAQGHGGEEQRACREAGEKRLSRAYGTRPCPGVCLCPTELQCRRFPWHRGTHRLPRALVGCSGLCCRSMETAAPCAAHGKVLAESFARHSMQLLRLGEEAAAETVKAAGKARGWLQFLHFTTALGGQTEVSEHSEEI